MHEVQPNYQTIFLCNFFIITIYLIQAVLAGAWCVDRLGSSICYKPIDARLWYHFADISSLQSSSNCNLVAQTGWWQTIFSLLHYVNGINCRPRQGSRHTLQKSAPETGAIGLNSAPESGTNFSCQCMTSNFIRSPKTVNDIRSRPSARKNRCRNLSSNLWHRFMELVSGVCVRGLKTVCGQIDRMHILCLCAMRHTVQT